MDETIVPGRFDGRTVIVTGAGSGIGRATAERLLREGATVIATDVRGDRLRELSDAMPDARLLDVVGDISARSTVQDVVDTADGRIDGLVNNAGIMDGFLPTAELDDETWERVLDVNVSAAARLTRAVLPVMLDRAAGSIVNVSSEAGLRGSCAGTAYTTSKFALNGFTLSTAFFYTPKGVRCNAVAPGGVATNIEADFRSAYAGERLGPLFQSNLPPVATPAQLAAAITWLLSDDASNVSGAILPCDGGWAAV